MRQLELTVTERIDTEQAQRLATELRAHLEVDGPYTRVRKAEPSAIPQYIQILGDVALWLVLLYPAKVFLKSYLETFGRRAADATCDGLTALFKKDEVKPLAEVATALADASSGRLDIIVGLNMPDRHSGTAMTITASSVVLRRSPHALAVFVTRANEIYATMKAEVEAGRPPLGRAAIIVEKSGGLTVRWRSKDFAEHEKHIP